METDREGESELLNVLLDDLPQPYESYLKMTDRVTLFEGSVVLDQRQQRFEVDEDDTVLMIHFQPRYEKHASRLRNYSRRIKGCVESLIEEPVTVWIQVDDIEPSQFDG